MTQLEKTIIGNARLELAEVLAYYREKATGSTGDCSEEQWLDYLGHYNALHALLMLAHQTNSGVSAEGMEALLKIEAEHAAAYRASTVTSDLRVGRRHILKDGVRLVDTHKVDIAREVIRQSPPDTQFMVGEDVSFLDLKPASRGK